jgi:hypothetical protein
MRLASRAFFALVALALACTDQGPDITVDGTWSGETFNNHSIVLTLSQSGTNVTGNGTIIAPLGIWSLTATGSLTSADERGGIIDLSITSTSGSTTQTLTLHGVVSKTSMLVSLNGGPYANEVVTLER